ncbi:MAG: hypothetical protein LRY55_02650, partial [Leadbetterella sp.]|nr:hypothetical protein [Leadbetterella sp.]
MARLPHDFPVDKLSVVESIQLEWFYTKYVEEYYNDYHFGHMVLAAYAAVPAYLTPDLLYRLWQNFGHYPWGGKKALVHPIAVSDVLLAPFCKEVSYELFRMDENVRLSFLQWIKKGRFSPDPSRDILTDLAHFIEQYMELPNETLSREGPRYKEEQLMEAKTYYDPFTVAGEYLEKLKNAGSETAKLSLINKLLKQKEKEEYVDLERKSLKEYFNNNELEIWKHLIQDNRETLKDQLIGNDLLTGAENGISVTLQEGSLSYSLSVPQTDDLVG